jgi:hypothetical protein
MIPFALVVARSGVAVEVAILPAIHGIADGQARSQILFVVIAGTEAIRIFRIDFPVVIVVLAVSALVGATTTCRLLAWRGAALALPRSGSIAAAIVAEAAELERASASSSSARTRARAAARCSLIIEAHLDDLSAGGKQLKEHAEAQHGARDDRQSSKRTAQGGALSLR